MEIIVVSDTHKDYRSLEIVAERHPTSDYFLHLGDGADEFEKLAQRFPQRKMLGVSGNCDFKLFRAETGILQCGIAKIFYTHGHRFNVKRGRKELIEEGLLQGANVILYGHTHIARVEYLDGVYVMNPGSLGCARGGEVSYGVIDVTDKEIVCRIVEIPMF